MEQRERPIPEKQASTVPAVDGANDDVLRAMATLLQTAREAVNQRLSDDSRRYLRAARQHGGQ
jgi:hypothetical protein